MIFICNCPTANVDNAMHLKDSLPLLSSLVVIILFIIDRWLGYSIRKKEIDRNWYFKILLEPNLKKIDKFFLDIETLYSTSSLNLKSAISFSHEEYKDILRNEFRLFKEKKRKFELEVIKPIDCRYSKTGAEMYSKIRKLDDYYINRLDSLKFDLEDIEETEREIYNYKANWLDCLYGPINGK